MTRRSSSTIGKKKGLEAAQSLMTTLAGAAPALLWKEEQVLLDQFHSAGKVLRHKGWEQPGNQLLPPDRSMENGIGKKKGLEAAQTSLRTTLAGAAPALLWKVEQVLLDQFHSAGKVLRHKGGAAKDSTVTT